MSLNFRAGGLWHGGGVGWVRDICTVLLEVVMWWGCVRCEIGLWPVVQDGCLPS